MIINYIIGSLRFVFRRKIKFPSYITIDSKLSKKAKVARFCKINCSVIGDYSYLAKNVELVNCDIGKFCSIAKDVKIGLANHTLDYLSTSPLFTQKNNGIDKKWIDDDIISNVLPRVIVKNDVWIGEGAMIKSGIIIENGAIIGAGALVTKDVPAYAIVGGVPAKIIRYRFSEDIIEKVQKIEWWNWPVSVIKNNIEIFQKPLDTNFIWFNYLRDE